MSYQIGKTTCINPDVAWLPPSDPPCPYTGKIWYFAADQYGNRISNYYNSEAEVRSAMAGATTLQVTRIQAAPSSDPSFPASAGWVKVDVSATGQGTFRILVDGVEVKRQGPVNASSGSSWGFYIQMQPGTHNVCAEAV